MDQEQILSCKIDISMVNGIFEVFYKSGLLYIFHKLASSIYNKTSNFDWLRSRTIKTLERSWIETH